MSLNKLKNKEEIIHINNEDIEVKEDSKSVNDEKAKKFIKKHGPPTLKFLFSSAKEGATVMFKGFAWVAKTTLQTMFEGLKFAAEGIRESNQEFAEYMREEPRGKEKDVPRDVAWDVTNNYYIHVESPRRPIWDIPSREEEVAERMQRYL